MITGPSRLARALGGTPARLRARPRLRRAAIAANLTLALVGVGLVGYPFATDAWARHVVQPRLAGQLDDPTLAASYRTGALTHDSAVTRLRIPRLGVDTVVVEGITVSALRAGAGHYPDTALPGRAGNAAIAGHRTTYGAPFRHLDRLRPGDEIVFVTPLGEVTYRVERPPFVVEPDDTTPVAPVARAIVTLTTCHPLNSSRERLVVQAALVGRVLA